MQDNSSEPDMNASKDPAQFHQHQLTLEDLPDVVIMSICNFLDASVIKILMQISTRFNQLLCGDSFWRLRIGRCWPKRYPAIPGMKAS